MINHAQYQPTPHDAAIFLKKVADFAKEVTGSTPNIYVGPHKLHPPVNGKPLDEKAAQAAFDALYGEKGTIVVGDRKNPVFRQQDGKITKDKIQLQTKMAPEIISPENEVARQKYQELYEKHPTNSSPWMGYEDRLKMPADNQKLADVMVKEMAIEETLSPEEFSHILGQGSAYVNLNLEAVTPKDPKVPPQVPEGVKYLAAMDSDYRNEFMKEAIAEAEMEPVLEPEMDLEPAVSAPDVQEDAFVYVAPDTLPTFDDPILQRTYARMDGVGKEINALQERATFPGNEYLIASGTPDNPSPLDVMKEQFTEAKTAFDARLDILGTRPPLEALPVNSLVTEEAEVISQETIGTESKVETLPSLEEISRDLTPDQRYAPPQESLEQTITQLTAKVEQMQAELNSMRKTMEKIAEKEPIPKVRAWAKNKLDTVLTKLQDRAKTDIALTVEHGKILAQKALDKIGSSMDQFQDKVLGLSKIHSDLKEMFEIHGNVPTVTDGDYTFNNYAGNISVVHKDRGEVFAIGDKGASLGRMNSNDYQKLSKISEAVAVIAGPAAIAAEVAKELAVNAVKSAVNEGAQRSALKV